MGKFQRIANVLKRVQIDRAEQDELDHVDIPIEFHGKTTYGAPGNVLTAKDGTSVVMDKNRAVMGDAVRNVMWSNSLTSSISMRDTQEKFRDLADKLEKGAVNVEKLSEALSKVKLTEPEPALWFNADTCCVISGEPAKFAEVVGHRGLRSITVCGKPSDWEVPHDVRAIEVPEEPRPTRSSRINSVLVNICTRHASEFYRDRQTHTRIGDKFFRLEFVDD